MYPLDKWPGFYIKMKYRKCSEIYVTYQLEFVLGRSLLSVRQNDIMAKHWQKIINFQSAAIHSDLF